MPRVTALESPASAATRRQPLLSKSAKSSAASSDCSDAKESSGGRKSKRGSRIGETAGECAAVVCCCPCTMVHLLVLAVYRLPRGLWRRKKREMLLRKKRRNSSAEAANRRGSRSAGGGGEMEAYTAGEDRGAENDVVDWDNEMWDRFYGAGFWRSASQRSDE